MQKNKQKPEPKMSPLINKTNFVDQLSQLLNTTKTEDLISQSQTEELINRGFVTRFEEYNVITAHGISLLVDIAIIN